MASDAMRACVSREISIRSFSRPFKRRISRGRASMVLVLTTPWRRTRFLKIQVWHKKKGFSIRVLDRFFQEIWSHGLPRPVIHKVFSMVPPLPRFFSLASSPIMTEAERKVQYSPYHRVKINPAITLSIKQKGPFLAKGKVLYAVSSPAFHPCLPQRS